MDASEVTGGLSGFASGLLDVGIILLIIILVVAVLLGLFFLIRALTRYSDFKVVIWEVLKNGGIRVKNDRGGIFLMKKTGYKLLYLQKSKVGLNPDKINYVLDNKGHKIIYLLRYGYKNFVFINPVADDLGNLDFTVGEEDVNWAITSYESNKKRFSQSLLVQLLPFMVLALVCIIILILMISLFKNFSVFSEVAQSINQASSNLATCTIKTGGVI